MAAKTNQEESVITLPTIRFETIKISVEGDTSLITNAWSDARIAALEQSQTGRARTKAVRDPIAEFEDSKYRVNGNGTCGIPADAFKKAAVDACRNVTGLAMVDAKVLFHVLGELVEIQGEPRLRRDVVRPPMGKAAVVYRAEFFPWSAQLIVRFLASRLSAEQVVNLFNLAGLCGVGCWRPSAPSAKAGNHGMFHVV